MKLFEPLYHGAMAWARHPRAPALLTLFSVGEAVIIPVPPEVMLAPMCLAQPRRGFRFASLSLAGSMVGATIGYALGHYAYALLVPLFESLGWIAKIDEQVTRLSALAAESPWQTFWLFVLAGFTPIPLKIFTWAAGIVGVPFLPFMASMLVGRGKRVYLIALAIRLGGERAERMLFNYIEQIGWAVTGVLVLIVGYLISHMLAA
jgi:membrane protein YqaA with SNARE-associated domain